MKQDPIRIEAAGVGITFLKIIRDIQSHFPARKSEWVLACMMFGWGITLLMHHRIFETSKAWEPLAVVATEETWGAVAVIVASARLCALILNGTFWQSWYGRYSPHVRAAGCWISALTWLAVCVGFSAASYVSTGVSIYLGLTILDAMNAYGAAADAGRMDGVRKREGIT